MKKKLSSEVCAKATTKNASKANYLIRSNTNSFLINQVRHHSNLKEKRSQPTKILVRKRN